MNPSKLNLNEAKPVTKLTGYTGAIAAMTVTPDGRYVIAATDDGVLVWDLLNAVANEDTQEAVPTVEEQAPQEQAPVVETVEPKEPAKKAKKAKKTTKIQRARDIISEEMRKPGYGFFRGTSCEWWIDDIKWINDIKDLRNALRDRGIENISSSTVIKAVKDVFTKTIGETGEDCWEYDNGEDNGVLYLQCDYPDDEGNHYIGHHCVSSTGQGYERTMPNGKYSFLIT